jgi:hypothetical protein
VDDTTGQRPVRSPGRPERRQDEGVLHRLAKLRQRHSKRDVGGHGREDVAAVERVADGQPVVAGVGQLHAGGLFGQGDAPAAFAGGPADLFR